MEQSAQNLGNYRVWKAVFNKDDTIIITLKDANEYKSGTKTNKNKQIFIKGSFAIKVLCTVLNEDGTTYPYVYETAAVLGQPLEDLTKINKALAGNLELRIIALEDAAEYICVMSTDNKTITMNTYVPGTIEIPANSLLISTDGCTDSTNTYAALTPYLVTNSTTVSSSTGTVMLFNAI